MKDHKTFVMLVCLLAINLSSLSSCQNLNKKKSVTPACSAHTDKRHCDESKNKDGAERCCSSKDCLGARTCSFLGYCKGKAFPSCTESNNRLYCDETKNKKGAHTCSKHEECSIGRICSSFGKCYKKSKKFGCSAHIDRNFCDENLNKKGKGSCKNNKDCHIKNLCLKGKCYNKKLPCSDHSIPRTVCLEKNNALGPGSCKTVKDCKIGKICNKKSVCVKKPKKKPCSDHAASRKTCDESLNKLGKNRCKDSKDCALNRVCSKFNFCHKKPIKKQNKPKKPSKENKPKIPSKLPCTNHKASRITCNESLNSYGSGKCKVDNDCSINRVCSSSQKCQNKPVKKPTSTKKPSKLPCTDHKASRKTCDESLNKYGKGKCKVSQDCALNRICSSFNYCKKKPVPTKSTSPPACTDHLASRSKCDEAKNKYGANRCRSDQDCALTRVCSSFHWCHKKVVKPNTTKKANACTNHSAPRNTCNEAYNSYGANRCRSNKDCANTRICSSAQWCQNRS